MKQGHRYISAFLLLLAGALCTYAIPPRPEPPRLVNDFAGILSPAQRATLERKLTAFDDSTSNQITVVTVTDLEGYSPAEYGTEIGLQWQVGSAKSDNGIVVLVKPKTASSGGQANISVGYGLEGAIPDSYAKRIITGEMIPAFQRGDYYAGIDNACTVLMKLASGEISEPREGGSGGIGSGSIILLVIIFLVIAALAGRGSKGGGGNGGSRRYADDADFAGGLIIGNILGSMGSGRSGGFGGGSFGGGFGGFGGGSFGGGGASGSW